MTTDLAPMDEAILIHQRLIHLESQALVARLEELCPQVELALEREFDPERFAKGVLSLMRPLTDHGRHVTFERLLNVALTRPTTPNTHAWLRVRLAEMALSDGNNVAALEHLQQLPQTRDDEPHLELTIYYASAMCARARADFKEACTQCQQGIVMARAAQAHKAYILLHNILGGVYIRSDEPTKAIETFEIALHHSKKHSITLFIDAIENNLASVSITQRQYQQAIKHLSQLYTRFEAANNHESLAVAASNLAITYAATGQWDRCRDTAWRAYELFEQGYWRGGCALCFLVLGIVALADDQQQEAQRELSRAHAAAHDEQRPDLQVIVELLRAISEGTIAPAMPSKPGHIISQEHWRALLAALTTPEQAPPQQLPPTNAIEALCWSLLRPQTQRARLWFNSSWDFSLDGQRWISLGRRAAARKLLEALAHAHPEPVEAWALFELAWPQDKVTSAQSINKLYTTIHRLRGLGLEEHLVTAGDGYALRGQLTFADEP